MTPSVDWSVIEALRMYSTAELDLVRELVNSFEETIAKQVPEMDLAVQGGDAATVRFIAHKLRGTCGHVGARRMEFLCERLEQLGRAGVTIGASELIEDLRTEFARVRVALNGNSGTETHLEPGITPGVTSSPE
jgi:HPt (histidine-containing phosphotransfer) domain-containing protein